jgi:2',3'-cyclic-nucleotide 2'-phosphodiesterase (5'-nucleotidase family)
VGYDALGLGELELELGVPYLAGAADRLPLVCANLSPDPRLEGKIPRLRWVEAGGRRIAVTAYVDPVVYYEWPHAFDPGEPALTDPASALAEVMKEATGADMVVLLAHAPREAIEDLVPQLPGIDVVVQGHDPEGPRNGLIGGVYFIIPGGHSRDVSLLTLIHDAQGKVVQVQPRTWTLAKMTEGDPRLDAMLKTFMDAHGLKREPPPAPSPPVKARGTSSG